MFGLFKGKTFKPATNIPDLSGKVILVTGGNTGLGYESIRQLAAHSPSHIYLCARTPSKGETAVSTLKTSHPNTPITYLPLDLSSFASITAAVQQFTSSSSRLDILMNNAGIMAVPAGETEDGYEIQFGTNHMGHALLTKLLMPTLQATAKEPGADIRIVNLTSEGHNFARTGSALLDKKALDASGAWVRYGYSKLANILFSRGLAKHYPNITAVAIHPGVIATDLYLPNAQNNFIVNAGLKIAGSLRGTVATGAVNQLWAATGKKDEVVNGSYYTPVGSLAGGSPLARNEKLADELWEFTERELQAKGF